MLQMCIRDRSLIREVGFVSLFTFIFSPRVGTPAASMPDPIPAEEKSAWFQEMTALQESLAAERLAGMVGSVRRALIENACDGYLEAVSYTHLDVYKRQPPTSGKKVVSRSSW